MEYDLQNWMVVFVRAGAFFSILPIFSAPNIPVQVRIALAALTGFLVAPGLSPVTLEHTGMWSLVRLFALEMLAGLTLGFVTRLVFYTVDLAGQIMANEMGLNLANAFNPFNQEQTQAPGMILFYLAALLLLTLDLHHWLLIAFQQSFTLLPVGRSGLSGPLLTGVIALSAKMFVVAVQLAAPLLAVSFVISLVFSILGRTVPQMNVFTESFAVRVLGGVAVFGATLNLMAQHIVNYLQKLPQDLARIAQLLGA